MILGTFRCFSNMLTMMVHHGGEFIHPPGCMWKGKIVYFDYVDIGEFLVHELNSKVDELGYCFWKGEVVYYYYLNPWSNLHFSLQALDNNEDVIMMSNFISKHKHMSIYFKHDRTTMHTFFLSPKKVILRRFLKRVHLKCLPREKKMLGLVARNWTCWVQLLVEDPKSRRIFL